LAAVAPTSGIALSPYPFPTGNGESTDVETDSASSRSSPVDLAPKIIQYSGGVAISAQDEDDQAECEGVLAVAENHGDF
jgi:hypothetical protein